MRRHFLRWTLLSIISRIAFADYVNVLDIDPSIHGICPAPLSISSANGQSICLRAAYPSSTVVVDTVASMASAGNLKGLRKYTQVEVTMSVYQKGSTDAFESGTRGTSLNSDDYVDGISFTIGAPRVHLFTFALGNAHDINLLTGGMCPCHSGTTASACGGDSPPNFVFSDMACDSGNSGVPTTGAWESRLVTASFTRNFPKTLDSIDVRIMCDEPNNLEDVGIKSLRMDIYEAEDNDPPLMTLNGDAALILELDQAFVDPGVTCFDAEDGSIVATTLWSPTILSTAVPENFVLSYICEDSRANAANLSRAVSVRDRELPRINVREGHRQCVEEGEPHPEFGAECADYFVGVWEGAGSGSVDTSSVGQSFVNYTCSDSSGNKAVGSRIVQVVSSSFPVSVLAQSFSMKTSRDSARTSVGLHAYLTNVDPSTDLQMEFQESIELNVEPCRRVEVFTTINSQNVLERQVESLDLSPGAVTGSTVVVTQSHSMSKVTDDTWPLCQNLGSCFSALDLEKVKEACLATSVCTGFSFSTAAIDGGIGNGCFKSCDDEGVNGHGDSTNNWGVFGFWRKVPTFNSFLSSGLRDLTSYTVIVNEHFVRASVGPSAGNGNVKHKFQFETGDYTAPIMISTRPADHELAWPVDETMVLTFDEPISGNDTAHVKIIRVADGASEKIPCNGSSVSGIRVGADGRQLKITELSAWVGWQGCHDYKLSIDSGCALDRSVNENPNADVQDVYFVTSCIIGFQPKHRAVGVSPASPIVFEFSAFIRLGNGSVWIGALGENAFKLGSTDYPNIYASGKKLVIDMACTTMECDVMRDNSTTSLGLCAGRSDQLCKGKVHTVTLDRFALELLNETWPAGSLLESLTGGIPEQLTDGSYTFTLAPADLTPPQVLRVGTTAKSETTLETKILLSEGGIAYCGAFGGWANDNCTTLSVVSDISGGFCSATVRDDCTSCESPSYGCINITSIWVDDGCTGIFQIDGQELPCASQRDDGTVYDGGTASVLSLGHRHACGILKSKTAPEIKCWGKAEYIDETTGLPPSGNFRSVALGDYHACAVRSPSGDIQCFGKEINGEFAGPTMTNISGLDSVTSGYAFSCAIRSDNANVECWGENDAGQSTPPTGVEFLAISAGNRHVCGIRADDHQVQCWGLNNQGQTNAPAGIKFLAQSPGGNALPEGSISAGWFHTCAIRELDHEVVCWGRDVDGQSSAPSSGGGGFIEVSAGRAHTCAIRRIQFYFFGGPDSVKGEIICWGLNDYGQLTPPVGARATAIGAGDDFTCAILINLGGALACWGKGDYSQDTPPSGVFGTVDSYQRLICSLTTSIAASIPRIRSASSAKLRGASSPVVYDPAVGYGEAILLLPGLKPGRIYDVYCFAQDAEWPVANVATFSQMAATHQKVQTLDQTPPSIKITKARASGQGELTLTLQSDEPCVAYCGVVFDALVHPRLSQLIGFGTSNASDMDTLMVTVTLAGLPPDTEFDAYCTAHDLASTHPDSMLTDNWMTSAEMVKTKFDGHTSYDSLPPVLLSTQPVHLADTLCEPDGFDSGCKTTITLTFNEDIYRGDGNMSFICMSNLGTCADVVVTFENDTFDMGKTFFENHDVTIVFVIPLVDASNYKVVIPESTVLDARGNSFEMDVQCAPEFDPRWQMVRGPCPPVYMFSTPF